MNLRGIVKKENSYKDGFLSSFALKVLACILMLIDHFAVIVIQGVYLNYYSKVSDLDKYKFFMNLYSLLRKIGRVSFPIFAFLIVVGFINTKNRYKYLIRMLIFSFLSEIIFDYAFFNKWFNFSYQNVLFTYTIVIITLLIIERINSLSIKKAISLLLKVGFIVIAALFGEIIKCDYGAYGILLSIIIYLTYSSKVIRTLAILIATSSQNIFSAFAIIPIYLYNGKRGLKIKYLFYCFYPLHLVCLYVLGIMCKNFL